MTRRAFRAAVSVAVLAVAATGCRTAAPKATSRSSAVVLPTTSAAPSPPTLATAASWSPVPVRRDDTPPGAASVLALSPRVLVVAAADGLWRSADAGRTWQRTASFGSAVAYDSVGRAGNGVVANVSLDSSGPTGRTNGNLYFSADGRSWRRVTPVVNGFGDNHSLAYLTVALDGIGPAAHGLAFATNANPAIISGPLLHSSDGGRHWRAVTGLDGQDARVQAVTFVPGSRTAFAAVAPPPYKSCAAILVRSDDGGATWRPTLAGCSADVIGALSFVDARHGFAAGRQLLVSSDAGRSWTATATAGPPRAADRRYAAMSFSSLGDGTVLAGACSASRDRDVPCTGEVWVTRDGGRRWSDAHLAALHVSGSGPTLLAAGGPGTPPGLSVSRDGGRSWARVVAPTDVHVQQLTGPPSRLLALTNGLSALSTDGGQTWRPAPAQVTAMPYQTVAQAGAVALRTVYPRLERSSDGGRTWTTVPLPTANLTVQPGEISFNRSDPAKVVLLGLDGSEHTQVLTSRDSGRSWALVSTVRQTAAGMVSYDGRSIVFTAGRVEVSRDDGRHFTRYAVGQDGYFLNSAGVSGTSVWVTGYAADHDPVADQVLVASSDDGGRTWDQHLLSGLGLDPYDHRVPDVLPFSGTEAVLGMDTDALLRTVDAGRTWRQERPTFPVR